MEKQLNFIKALREVADDIATSPKYQWGHMGKCNCGFLAQKLTGLTSAQIHRNAMARRGDWSDQLNDYCPNSGYPIDHIIFNLLQAGLKVEDLAHLERLSDQKILNRISENHKPLYFNQAADVSLYMKAWADKLEDEVLSTVKVQSLTNLLLTNNSSSKPIYLQH
ncbi:hypothetical protein C3K47_18280 [Solitalea longa]|uniref:Uncharacterized protein n=1 Tax=Solitalea longa TaxID=2079460 RepID=A0A2S4ZWP8_9SPHI|nr:hypothetical protein [Solitalea longa]POY34788.1 hypothetical protein C3K47_18280 [Solitalea longa]